MTGGIPRSDYHSAHKKPVRVEVGHDHFRGSGVTAFVHDITAGDLPADFHDCDVLVTDLPWRKGFDEFNRRAGVSDGRTYPEFMRAVSAVVTAATVPTWLITGKHAEPYLPAADITLPMRLNEDEAVAYGYRPGPEAFGDYGIAQEFLHALTQHYDKAGDFCCGYGRTGRFFVRAVKQAVLSDINRLCIGYIATHADEWTA